MIVATKQEVFSECEKLGENATRARLEQGHWGPNAVDVREWLQGKEQARENIRDFDDKQRFIQEIDIAERALNAATDSAVAARTAAKWTMIAAIASCIAALATMAQSWFTQTHAPAAPATVAQPAAASGAQGADARPAQKTGKGQ